MQFTGVPQGSGGFLAGVRHSIGEESGECAEARGVTRMGTGRRTAVADHIILYQSKRFHFYHLERSQDISGRVLQFQYGTGRGMQRALGRVSRSRGREISLKKL